MPNALTSVSASVTQGSTSVSCQTTRWWPALTHLFLSDKAHDASCEFRRLLDATSAPQQIFAFTCLTRYVAPAHSGALQWKVFDDAPPNFVVGNLEVKGCPDWMSSTDDPITLAHDDRMRLSHTLGRHAIPEIASAPHSEVRTHLHRILAQLDAASRVDLTTNRLSTARRIFGASAVGDVSTRRADVQIRELTAEDATPFQALRLHALRMNPTAFEMDYDEEVELSPTSAWAKATKSPNGIVIGAFDDNGLIGMLGLRPLVARKRSHNAALWGMFVHEKASGRGIGRQLLSSAIALARTMPQLTRLSLVVSAASASAISLYESQGFVKTGTDPDSLRCDGRSYDAIHMNLPIVEAADTPTNGFTVHSAAPGAVDRMDLARTYQRTVNPPIHE
ncbi:GNAT family N-acetyltransferase [Pandoraea captiosa]|nr:GNAT family N-acetyltransferase [Pandoraea captiosa]